MMNIEYTDQAINAPKEETRVDNNTHQRHHPCEREDDEDDYDDDVIYQRDDAKMDEKDESLCSKCGFERKLLAYQNFFFWFYARVGAISPYNALYLKQLGLVPWQMGVIGGVRPFAGFLCGPLWGMLADRFNIHRQLLYFCIFGFSLFVIAIANVPPSEWTEQNCASKGLICLESNTSYEVSSSVSTANMSCHFQRPDDKTKEHLLKLRDWMFDPAGIHRIFLTMLLLSIFGQFLDMPINSLADTESLQLLGKSGVHKYGFVRRPGSLGLGIFSFSVGAVLHQFRYTRVLCGLEIPETEYKVAFYTGVICLICNALSVSCFGVKPNAAPKGTTGNKKMRLGRAFSVFTSVHYGSWLVCMIIMGMCNGVIWSFLFWHLENIGATQMLIGVACVLTYSSELVIFSLVFIIRDRIGTFAFMIIGIAGYAVRFVVFAVIENPWWVLPMEVLQGFSAGVWCILVAHLCGAVPPDNVATMQGILHGVYWGLGSGTGDIVGGQLVGTFGARNTFWIMSVVSLINLVTFALAQKLSRKPEFSDMQSSPDVIPLIDSRNHKNVD